MEKISSTGNKAADLSKNKPVKTDNKNSTPETVSDQILNLQRTIGNQAVNRLIQSGAIQPDVTTSKVMRMKDTVIQRKTSLEEKKPLQRKFLQRQEESQTNLFRQAYSEGENINSLQRTEASSETVSLEQRLPSKQQSEYSGQVLGQTPEITHRIPPNRIHRCPFGSTPPLTEVINDNKKNSPETIADQLSAESEEFQALRGTADAQVKETFGKDKLKYSDKPKKGGGSGPAYYKDGETFFDKDAPPPQTVLNVVFETANAAQAGKFKKVEDDYDHNTILETSYADYGVDTGELGGLDVAAKEKWEKRSLIQEYYEWKSFMLAKSTFMKILPNFEKKGAHDIWTNSFGLIMECKNFMEYYEKFGKGHRSAVESTLKPKSGGKQIDISKLF